jgi:hypothetical protein
MKSLLIVFAVLLSSPSFAAILDLDTLVSVQAGEPVKPEQAAKIRQALESELRKSTFECKYSVSMGPSNRAIAGELISVIKDERAQISISSDLSQPVIQVIAKGSSTYEITILFTTTPDFKKLVKVEATRGLVKQVVKNTGTLIDPKFETVTERTVELAGSCSIQ